MCADQLRLADQIKSLEQAAFDFLHVDIMDMSFVPNLAMGFDVLKQLGGYHTPKDIHLMVKNVKLAIQKLQVSKEDYISFHVEAVDSPAEIISSIRKIGVHPGLVINPSTPLEKIFLYLDQVDIVHVMTVEPGFSGKPFISNSYKRVKKLKNEIMALSPQTLLGVDGGIGFEQIVKFQKAGASVFVLGTTSLFKSNFEEQLDLFKQFREDLLER